MADPARVIFYDRHLVATTIAYWFFFHRVSVKSGKYDTIPANFIAYLSILILIENCSLVTIHWQDRV